jgi:hypothetical protein
VARRRQPSAERRQQEPRRGDGLLAPRTGIDARIAAGQGSFAAAAAAFSKDALFVVPGASALAAPANGTVKVEPIEVLANDRHMVLFFRFVGRRDGTDFEVVAAGFHSDRGPDGWRRATFLPDNQAAFDRLYSKT